MITHIIYANPTQARLRAPKEDRYRENYLIECIEHKQDLSLETLQHHVAGLIESVPFDRLPQINMAPVVAAYVNEEGRLLELSYNVWASLLLGYAVYGNVIIQCESKLAKGSGML